jgi:hypothetical protein
MRPSIVFIMAVVVLALPVVAQDSGQKDKSLDVRSSVGDLHVGPDADAKKAGLPLYPGARLLRDENSRPLNFGLLMENFGMKLVVAKYESADAPDKVISYYRGKLKRYGKVLECHAQKQDDGVQVQVQSDDAQSSGKNSSKELTCDQNSGPVTELKVGSDDNQHIVSVEPHDSAGCTFSLVYLHKRGKDDEI